MLSTEPKKNVDSALVHTPSDKTNNPSHPSTLWRTKAVRTSWCTRTKPYYILRTRYVNPAFFECERGMCIAIACSTLVADGSGCSMRRVLAFCVIFAPPHGGREQRIHHHERVAPKKSTPGPLHGCSRLLRLSSPTTTTTMRRSKPRMLEE